MLRVWMVFIVVTVLAGCELLQPRATTTTAPEPAAPAKPTASSTAASPSSTAQVLPSDNHLREHLQFIDRLNNRDARQLDQIHAQTAAAFEQQPDSDNRLRLAWVLATPGHAHSNPWAARKQLRTSLNDEQLPPALARLVRVRLKDIERNLQIADKLSEAEDKLRALTTLEHSMEERDAEVQEE